MYIFLPDDILCQYINLPTRWHFMSICISSYQRTFYVYVYLPTRRHFMSICISSYQTTFHVNMYIFLKEFRTHEKIVLNVTILLQWHGRRNNVEIGSLSVDWFQCRVLQRKVMKCETWLSPAIVCDVMQCKGYVSEEPAALIFMLQRIDNLCMAVDDPSET